jgi:hypothetical protein
VRLDPKIPLTKVDEDGEMQDGVATKVAQTNFIIIQNFAHKRVHGNSKSLDEIILENYKIGGVGDWIP